MNIKGGTAAPLPKAPYLLKQRGAKLCELVLQATHGGVGLRAGLGLAALLRAEALVQLVHLLAG